MMAARGLMVSTKNFENNYIIPNLDGDDLERFRFVAPIVKYPKLKAMGEALGKILLRNADVFIGSGGTMTAESALSSVPTISYNAVPNIIENYLVRKKLIIRERNPKQIVMNNLLEIGKRGLVMPPLTGG